MGVHKRIATLLGMAILIAGFTASPPPALAQSGSAAPLVTASIVRDFARITFYWGDQANLSASTDGNRLVLKADRPMASDFGPVLSALYPYIIKADISSNKRTVIFTMKAPYSIRTFVGDGQAGVDILGIQGNPAPAAKPTAKEAPPAPIKTTAPKANPAPKAAPASKAPSVTPKPKPTPPPAPKTETPAAHPQATEPVTTPTKAPTQVAVPTHNVAEPVKIELPSAKIAPVVAPAIAAEPTPLPPPSLPAKSNVSTINGPAMPVELSVVDVMPTLRFPWQERVAAAVWSRGNSVWIVFNKPVTLQGLDKLPAAASNWLASATQVGGSTYAALQLNTLTPVFVTAQKDPQGSWLVSISSQDTTPAQVIPVEINATVKEPFVLLSATEVADPIRMQDPDAGTSLQILPLYAGSTGVDPSRSFAEFSLMETAQGAVVESFSDSIIVSRLRNGIKIDTPGGLFLSSSLPETTKTEGAPLQQKPIAQLKPSLFNYSQWKVPNSDAFQESERYLLNAITHAPSLYKQSQLRKKLAQLNLGEGFTNEALAVLGRIRETDPNYYDQEKLAALEGAALLLNYRLQEAQLRFASPFLEGVEEVDLWKKAVAAGLSSDAEPVPFLENSDAYISQYPPNMRQRLAILAANHSIGKQDYIAPLKIFSTLQADNQITPIQDYVDFLRAQIAAAVERPTDAKEIWTRMANNVDDRQFRARAEFSLTLMGLQNQEITTEEAIKRLERIRIVWRGDDLDRAILQLIGQLYVNQGDFWNGMKAWEELMQFFPNTQEAIDAYQHMADTFRMLFLDNVAKDMKPLQALALYNEFQELTPLGDDGKKMVQNLVDRLVEVDLLDQATARLETQLQYRLQGEEKSVIGARLAYLHILNREPEQALTVLQDSRIPNVPPELSLQRNRLAAQALIDLKKPEQSLIMIDGDFSPEAEAIRLDAYWAMSDWANVVDMIELSFRSRPDLNAPFNPEEGKQLIRLALAYQFLGEYDQMKYLRDAYTPLMENNPYKDEFQFIAQDRISVDEANFQKVVDSIGTAQTFLSGFRDKVRKLGLSHAIDAEPAPAKDAAKPAAEPAKEEAPLTPEKPGEGGTEEGASPPTEDELKDSEAKQPDNKTAPTEEKPVEAAPAGEQKPAAP